MDVSERREFYSGFGDTLAVAFEFAATPLLFGFIGHFVDNRLGTGPWLTILLVVFALVGLTARMYYGYVAAMEEHESRSPWAKPRPRAQPQTQVVAAEPRPAGAAHEPPIGAL